MRDDTHEGPRQSGGVKMYDFQRHHAATSWFPDAFNLNDECAGRWTSASELDRLLLDESADFMFWLCPVHVHEHAALAARVRAHVTVIERELLAS